MLAIFKREFKSYFKTPIGYIVLAAYYLILGIFFTAIFTEGTPGVHMLVLSMSIVVAFTVPIITMRLMSEDRRSKVDQILLTSPVRLTGIVLGKFFAAMCVYALGFAPTVIFELIVAGYVKVNVFSYVYALFGMMLLGAACIAIGMFISSLTESPAVSAIVTLVVSILLIYMSVFSTMVNVKWISKILEKAAFFEVLESFGKTVFSVSDVVYFLSIAAAFLFLTVRSLEKRRWA